MDITTLNDILDFIESDYRVHSSILESGQRKVYVAKKNGFAEKYVLKVCPLHPISVARIQREIKILSELDSEYFPKFDFQYFVTDEIINYFIDNFDPKTQQERITQIMSLKLNPFLVTVEEHIEHMPWKGCVDRLRDERTFLIFLRHLFAGLNLLWEKKIVHRDLKPDNILIRPDLRPVIIDLGIAKSMSEGATIITNPAFPSPCTPRFAAPEQLTNNKTEVTYKTDQFAVGVIAFLVLTGKFPYGNDAEIGIEGVVHNCLSGKMESFRKYNTVVSDGVVKLIERLIRVHPFQRFRTLEEIMGTLADIEGAK